MEDFDFNNFSWLIGQWEGIQGNGIYHEEWSADGENKLTGKAYFISKGELSNPEKLSIVCGEDGVCYIADVSHNTGPVSFRMTKSNDTLFVFENPEHDFPQKITYEKISENELTAIIEGDSKGRSKKISFHLKKIY
ncbi:MAG: hypothetical protein IPM38_08390 [Ignavibacteria bacterium]|nr:hypothetical protein [Ignavibacteria bacterium]